MAEFWDRITGAVGSGISTAKKKMAAPGHALADYVLETSHQSQAYHPQKADNLSTALQMARVKNITGKEIVFAEKLSQATFATMAEAGASSAIKEWRDGGNSVTLIADPDTPTLVAAIVVRDPANHATVAIRGTAVDPNGIQNPHDKVRNFDSKLVPKRIKVF